MIALNVMYMLNGPPLNDSANRRSFTHVPLPYGDIGHQWWAKFCVKDIDGTCSNELARSPHRNNFVVDIPLRLGFRLRNDRSNKYVFWDICSRKCHIPMGRDIISINVVTLGLRCRSHDVVEWSLRPVFSVRCCSWGFQDRWNAFLAFSHLENSF